MRRDKLPEMRSNLSRNSKEHPIAVVSGVIEITFDCVRSNFSVLLFVRFGGFHEVFICFKLSRRSRSKKF